METYILRQLAAFAEYGTLSRVAEELHTSQPAISRSMQKLEDELEVPLFSRGKNRIALNEFGVLAAEHAKRIMQAHDDMQREVRAAWQKNRTFSFGAVAPMPIHELSPVIAQIYMGVHITADLQETEEPLFKGLDDGTYRLIVLNHDVQESAYYSQFLFREKLSVLLPKKHRLSRRKSLKLSDLRGENILIHRDIGFWFPLCKEKIPDANFLEQKQLSVLRQIVMAADLPSFMTNISYKDTPVPKNKVSVPLQDAETDVRYWCVCRKDARRELEPLFSQIRTMTQPDAPF